MKNVIKVMEALIKAFPGHHVVSRFIEGNYSTESVFIDGKCVGLFYEDFLQKDFDNPEIEIKVKVSLEDIKDYLSDPDRFAYRVFDGLERGFTEWENESHPNS